MDMPRRHVESQIQLPANSRTMEKRSSGKPGVTQIVVGLTISLDGFLSDMDRDVGPLYPDFETLRESQHLHGVVRATGAVAMGRRSYEMGNGDVTAHEFQVPIFVVTHEISPAPAKLENAELSFTFVSEGIARTIELPKAAAGPREVTVVGGPDVIQHVLDLNLVDELHFDLRSLLLGDGLRLFERSARALRNPPVARRHASSLSGRESDKSAGLRMTR